MLHPLVVPVAQPGLADACGPDPGLVCRAVFGLTGDAGAARWADLVLAKPATIALIFLVALALRSLARRAIGKLAASAAASNVPRVLTDRAATVLDTPLLRAERRRQRMDTVASVLRTVASVAILAVAATLALGELGVNLAPIVASAGIVGIAVGFGAQNVVKDFLSGIFMIMEDQYGVGDVVDAGEATGTVEAIGLRTTRLRDGDGVVWHLRNGEITRVGNVSQGWARAVLDIPVADHEDARAAVAPIETAAGELWRDEAFADRVLEEPEVWVVEAPGGGPVAIRVAVTPAPRARGDVTRELRDRIAASCAAAGVQLPLPRRSVWVRAAGGPRAAAPPAGPPAGPHVDPDPDGR